MKKITGKVVSLVLALALVVTSFSANFAFASTKSVTGTADFDGEDTIYLVNGGADEAARKVTGFSSWVKGTVDTKDHQDGIGTAEISAISHVSGDKLIKWNIDDDWISLRSKDSEGKEVISILFKATYTNDDGDDVTVKGSKQFTIYAFDKEAALVRMYDSAKPAGKAPDEVGSFARNDDSYKEIAVYKATSESSTSAKATWNSFYTPVIKSGSQDTSVDATALGLAGVNTTNYKENYFVYSDNKYVTLTHGAGSELEATITAPTDTKRDLDLAPTGNVTITAKKILNNSGALKVSSDSDDRVTVKTKIDKKVIAPLGYDSIGKDKGTYLFKSTGTLDNDDSSNIDVSNTEVVFGGGDNIADPGMIAVTVSGGTVKKISGKVTSLTITEATVSTVDIDNGDVIVSDDDAKVGDITTDNEATVNTGKVTVSAGKVGNINACDADVDTVEVAGGTTGTIKTDGIVNVITTDEDTPAITGDISAKEVNLDSSNGKVSVGTIKSTTSGATIKLESGDYALSVKGFDFDYRDTALTLSEFTGKIAAPVNALNGSISYETDEDDEILTTVTGALNIDSITTDEYTTLAFDNTVEVDDVSGSGAIKVLAGKLYVTESASGTLKLADSTLTAGMVAFKADSDAVDVDDFDCFGFTVAKTAGSSVDTFKVASTNFGGIVIDKSDINVAIGQKQVFTAVAYPTGTVLPTGSQVSWDFSGNSEVFDVTYSGNTATVKVLKTDATFASENVGTLTATLQDADGYDLDDYDAATATVNAVATPDATSDTNSALSVAKGASYTMKVTSAAAPAVTTGSNGVFSVVLASKNGNNYFYKLTATGDAGKATGVYLNGKKIFVATVKAFAFTSDTTKATTVKGAYTFKITADATPTVSVGNAAFKLTFVSKTGNAYLYTITSAGAKGAAAGVYVNNSKVFVATVG